MKTKQQMNTFKNVTIISNFVLAFFWLFWLAFAINAWLGNLGTSTGDYAMWIVIMMLLVLVFVTGLLIYTKDAIQDIVSLRHVNNTQNNKLYRLEKELEALKASVKSRESDEESPQ